MVRTRISFFRLIRFALLAGVVLLTVTFFNVYTVFPAESAEVLVSSSGQTIQAAGHLAVPAVSRSHTSRMSRAVIRRAFRRAAIVVLTDESLGIEISPENLAQRRALQAGALSPAMIRQREGLDDFVAAVPMTGLHTVAGVFVSDSFAMPVRQQPAGKPGYVASTDNILTQFGLASQHGTIGLLAHNYLAGARFFNFSSGQSVYIVFGDGTVQEFEVTEIRRFQAKQPNSAFSDFLDLDQANVELSVESLFYQIYQAEDQVVFQTCIEKDGISTWGRLFVIATAEGQG
jgi:hypothetical protein